MWHFRRSCMMKGCNCSTSIARLHVIVIARHTSSHGFDSDVTTQRRQFHDIKGREKAFVDIYFHPYMLVNENPPRRPESL